MHVPIEEADERLDELADLAIAGEEVFLTRDGQLGVQLTPFPADLEANPLTQGG
ncbi:MAG: hypothetical protein WDN45_03740 [Caulobacteraceae bacterium]